MNDTTRTTAPVRLALMALVFVLVFAAAGFLSGCGADTQADAPSEAPVAATAAFPVTVTDDAGREVTIDAEPQRIVSLTPANTELVAAVGLLDRLVGVTSFCDYPPEVVSIDIIGDFASPNLEAVAAAEPDIVLATAGVQADVIGQLEDLGAVVVAVDPVDLESLFASIEMVGVVTGTSEAAGTLVSSMRSELDAITVAIGDVAPVSCFLEIAQDPLFTAGPGTLLDDLITAAGGANVVTQDGYVGYSVEQLVTDDPAVYLATLGSMSDPADLSSRPGYGDIDAVKTGRVFVLEDNLVSRPGPRVVEGVRLIAEALHPDAF
ncbi:MAG: ABC transporter substrate-binding protein [Anaerosomatales bacterium]|nr:ABC transporter substrate-binding protein [Anaerosomatales bacterium]MDT8434323.1 ABC transporter substrate-binding protein [Anaerosomatales bacterium]